MALNDAPDGSTQHLAAFPEIRAKDQEIAKADDPIVVEKDDFASFHLRANFPGLSDYLAANFREVYRVGAYRVLRKNAARSIDDGKLAS